MIESLSETQNGAAVAAETLLEVRNLKMWFERRKGFLGRRHVAPTFPVCLHVANGYARRDPRGKRPCP